MGRELRTVPADWKHPKRRGHYVPLHDGSFAAALAQWEREREAFENGLNPDGSPLSESAQGCTFENWHGSKPEHIDYWSAEKCTHFQMYETCSEGTPISPVLESPEAVARWCADNGASAFGGETAPYEWWLKVCAGKAGFGIMIDTAARTMEVV